MRRQSRLATRFAPRLPKRAVMPGQMRRRGQQSPSGFATGLAVPVNRRRSFLISCCPVPEKSARELLELSTQHWVIYLHGFQIMQTANYSRALHIRTKGNLGGVALCKGGLRL